jgi:hypothetical protein
MSIFRCCLQISTILSSVLFISSLVIGTQKKQLKSNANKIYITQDLTRYIQQLVSKIQIARKERRIDSFWTNDGRIFLKKTSSEVMSIFRCCLQISTILSSVLFSSSLVIGTLWNRREFRRPYLSTMRSKIGKIHHESSCQLICRFRNWKIKNQIFKQKKQLKSNANKFISPKI